MITRLTSRITVCLLALPLLGALITVSVRMDAGSQEMGAISQEIVAANAATAGIDIPALNAKAGTASLPVVAVGDPI